MTRTPNITKCVITDGADPAVMVAATLTLTALTPRTAEALVTGPRSFRIPLDARLLVDWHTCGWASDDDLLRPVLILRDHRGAPQIVCIEVRGGRPTATVVRTTEAALARLTDDLAHAPDVADGLDGLLTAGGAA